MRDPLPSSAQQLADVIGADAVFTLIQHWPRTAVKSTSRGRLVLYVPARLPDGHRLVSILGWDTAQAMVKVFGGELLFLASCAETFARQRRQAILEELETGASVALVARVHGLSERHVRRMAQQDRAASEAPASTPDTGRRYRIQ